MIPPQAHPDDPFAGYPPQPIRCRWLSDHDKEIARSADIIRLIVDDQRGYPDAWANDLYNQRFLRDVSEFIGETRAVIATPAGTITVSIDTLTPTRPSLEAGLGQLQQALKKIERSSHEFLLGMDGAVASESTPLQTVVHLTGELVVSLANTTLKIYPAAEEYGTLFGWQLCQEQAGIPAEAAHNRVVQTSAGKVLVFVCNDAVIFSARSLSNLKSDLGLCIRAHFLNELMTEPGPAYILMATHWNGKRGGEAFRTAARHLNELSGATVVFTMRTPKPDLEATADRFESVGPRADQVATLLVEDTVR